MQFPYGFREFCYLITVDFESFECQAIKESEGKASKGVGRYFQYFKPDQITDSIIYWTN